ncbi:phage integrase family protein [Janthinobacterium sp. HH103]|nr:phage integrase family protein [Janthinobacterium sp. HH100]OEZ68124.1 phage integrase family protein [Janthinobacterium sp. HH103]
MLSAVPSIEKQSETANADLISAEISRVLPSGLTAEQIQHKGKDELLALQRHFNLGTIWGEIRIPDEWLSDSIRPGAGTVNLYKRLGTRATSQSTLELAVLTAMRMVLLAFCSPSKSGRQFPAYLGPSSILTKLTGAWINFLKFALGQPAVDNGGMLGRLGSYTFKRTEYAEGERFRNFHSRGLWWDPVPVIAVSTIAEESNLSANETPDPLPTSPTTDPYLPLPDALVHQVGLRAAWIVKDLMPVLLEAYRKVAAVQKSNAHLATSMISRSTTAFLSAYIWKDTSGKPIKALPFQLDVEGSGVNPIWPPSNQASLQAYLRMGQMANFFVVGLSAGPRAGEINSFTTNCLRTSRDGMALANGQTYKLVDRFEGEERDWPMPKLAVQAIQHQITLSKLVTGYYSNIFKEGKEPLWRTFYHVSKGGVLSGSHNDEMRKFVTNLGLNGLLDEQSLSHHRFRKTIARLVALAYVHAPKILMDVFGHKSIEMTMHYILADPTILAQMRTIRKELVLIMAKKAIQNASMNGGPAASKIRTAVREMKFRHADDYGVDNEDDLAMILTGQGVFWMQPRPGVICTKLLDQVGPCAKGRSQPNPARCQSDCSFRLEEADNRAQVDETIADIVKKIQRAWAHEDEMLAGVWAGQLVTHVKRFDDLMAKWKTHPIVKTTLNREIRGVEDVGA